MGIKSDKTGQDTGANELTIASMLPGRWRPVRQRAPFAAIQKQWSVEEKLDFLRQSKIGRLTSIQGPDFWRSIYPSVQSEGQLPLLHLDYTASAQALAAIERYLQDCLQTYANTHTETSETGRRSTRRFHEALEMIRSHVNAGPHSFVLATGYGATGAIERIQQILGLYVSPRAQKVLQEVTGVNLKEKMKRRYVVFVGPFEHHSNDVSWQDDALCEFVRIRALRKGPNRNQIDLEDLEKQLKRFPDHVKIGSFSAASNVTGFKADIRALGELLHRYGAYFFADYAAAGPYADIDMLGNHIDALFLSAHKNLGGANLGLLIGHERLYDLKVNPSFGGGGTVTAVTPWEYRFHDKIEEREFPGTPAIRQLWQAALSFQIKDWLGSEHIHAIEESLCREFMNFFNQHPQYEILGNPSPEKRYPIFSFLIRHGDKHLHHTYVAALLNDLFGIQARSGCACAGPFGHELLNIEKQLSDKYLTVIQHVLNGFKPGWTRIGTHYTMSRQEASYLRKVLSAVGWFGPLYLDQYCFDPFSGDWYHTRDESAQKITLSIEDAFALPKEQSYESQLESEADLYRLFENRLEEFYLLTAFKIVELFSRELQKPLEPSVTENLAGQLQPVIKNFCEADDWTRNEFCAEVSTIVCPVLKPYRPIDSSCEAEVIETIHTIIFEPQKRQSYYEQFDGILKDVQFFYVWKSRLLPKINRLEELDQPPEPKGPCRPCGPLD